MYRIVNISQSKEQKDYEYKEKDISCDNINLTSKRKIIDQLNQTQMKDQKIKGNLNTSSHVYRSEYNLKKEASLEENIEFIDENILDRSEIDKVETMIDPFKQQGLRLKNKNGSYCNSNNELVRIQLEQNSTEEGNLSSGVFELKALKDKESNDISAFNITEMIDLDISQRKNSFTNQDINKILKKMYQFLKDEELSNAKLKTDLLNNLQSKFLLFQS